MPLRWADVHTKFHENWVRHSKVVSDSKVCKITDFMELCHFLEAASRSAT
jgi:hypothetical protein